MILEQGDELETVLVILKYLLLGANVFLFLTAVIVFLTSSVNEKNAPLVTSAQYKRALIVTAHPDDESMFFLPLVHSLQQQHEGSKDVWKTHLLCLSRGNADGRGDVRVKELYACSTYIGLSTDHVKVLEDPNLQDGMNTQWDTGHIASVVSDYIKEHKIDAVFTFDDYGVSGHANHIATHFGVKKALRNEQESCEVRDSSKAIRGWALESTNIFRKYAGVLDTLLSFWMARPNDGDNDKNQCVFVFRPRWNYNAMALHQSQFVWYRRLFVIFSRFTYVNTFRPLLSIDSQLPADQKKIQ